MRTAEWDRLDREITQGRAGAPEAYAEALERAFAACQDDPNGAE